MDQSASPQVADLWLCAVEPVDVRGAVMLRPVADVALSRRIQWLLFRTLAFCVALAVSGPMPAPAYASVVEAPAATALRLTLPAPSGNHRIGVLPLHLVDRDRRDPWVASKPARELMVSLWYPARRTHARPVFPWLTPGAWNRFGQDNGLSPGSVQLPFIRGSLGAGVDWNRGARLLTLYSRDL